MNGIAVTYSQTVPILFLEIRSWSNEVNAKLPRPQNISTNIINFQTPSLRPVLRLIDPLFLEFPKARPRTNGRASHELQPSRPNRKIKMTIRSWIECKKVGQQCCRLEETHILSDNLVNFSGKQMVVNKQQSLIFDSAKIQNKINCVEKI